MLWRASLNLVEMSSDLPGGLLEVVRVTSKTNVRRKVDENLVFVYGLHFYYNIFPPSCLDEADDSGKD